MAITKAINFWPLPGHPQALVYSVLHKPTRLPLLCQFLSCLRPCHPLLLGSSPPILGPHSSQGPVQDLRPAKRQSLSFRPAPPVGHQLQELLGGGKSGALRIPGRVREVARPPTEQLLDLDGRPRAVTTQGLEQLMRPSCFRVLGVRHAKAFHDALLAQPRAEVLEGHGGELHGLFLAPTAALSMRIEVSRKAGSCLHRSLPRGEGGMQLLQNVVQGHGFWRKRGLRRPCAWRRLGVSGVSPT
mmetsp:Transcript_51861/g.116239  ORF Transcript_51861/g.116239 Transcript_51861/m.116239 type:complete len:243 (+) Transcript_51861:1195-1923(+)